MINEMDFIKFNKNITKNEFLKNKEYEIIGEDEFHFMIVSESGLNTLVSKNDNNIIRK
jgi:hypothetical protein